MGDNHLRSALKEKRFFYSAELVLNRDHTVPEAETFVRDAAREPDGIKIISLTDLPGGNPALPPEAFVATILDSGLTPLAHLTGKDGNRSFVEGRLHSLARMGVENILALTGDAQNAGFQGKAKPVYDLDSVLILWLIQAMRGGIPYNVGQKRVQSTPFDFFAGAVVNPFKTREPDQMMQFYKLKLKVALGCRFIITQLGFNLRKLYETKQYMVREGLDHVPLVANVYVPTATVAKMMQAGEVAGCVIPDELIRRLEKEKKPRRLERAALMAAAAKKLGFAGAHIGGFGLTHQDFMTILELAATLGRDWQNKPDELFFESPNEFYLFPRGQDGLSDGAGPYQITQVKSHISWKQRLPLMIHDALIRNGSLGARLLSAGLKANERDKEDKTWRKGFWYRTLGMATLYRKATLGCVGCGDCIQEHLNFAGCTMRWCYKNLRNGPCGGSRVDGSCEADPSLPCIWNLVYLSTVAVGEDPNKFARTVIPPRDWCLDQTNALANRLIGLDNYCRRRHLDAHTTPKDDGPGKV